MDDLAAQASGPDRRTKDAGGGGNEHHQRLDGIFEGSGQQTFGRSQAKTVKMPARARCPLTATAATPTGTPRIRRDGFQEPRGEGRGRWRKKPCPTPDCVPRTRTSSTRESVPAPPILHPREKPGQRPHLPLASDFLPNPRPTVEDHAPQGLAGIEAIQKAGGEGDHLNPTAVQTRLAHPGQLVSGSFRHQVFRDVGADPSGIEIQLETPACGGGIPPALADGPTGRSSAAKSPGGFSGPHPRLSTGRPPGRGVTQGQW